MTIKAIIFDLGGVIVELDFTIFFKDVIIISPLNKPHSTLLLEFWRQSDIFHQGKMTNKEFYHQSCELLQFCDISQERFYESFNSVISHYNQEVVNFIKKIKDLNKYKLILLSNINASHWQYLLNKGWSFIEYFDQLILSHEVHMTKPDPKILQYTIEKAGCTPEEIIFVDDGLNNVRAAQELSINAVKFINLEELIEEFKKLGVTIL